MAEDGGVQDRPPGRVLTTLDQLDRATDALEKRVALLTERLSSVRRIVPRPSASAEAEQARDVCSPVADRLGTAVVRLQALEGRVGDLLGEVEL